MSLMGLLYVSTAMSVVEVKDARRSVDDLRSIYLAEAGVERGMNLLAQAVKNTSAHDPLQGLIGLFQGGNTVRPFTAEPVLDGAAQVGCYTVTLRSIAQTANSFTIEIDSTGYARAAPTGLVGSERIDSWHSIAATVRYSLAPSRVFDFGYFVNNWGWFYGDTIYCNGNAGSNGQFAVAGYSPTVTGQPLYDGLTWSGGTATLSDYHDDNGDGLNDGNDGGIFAGWDITNAQNVKGNGGKASNQHDFENPIEMPNLSDLTRYEANAVTQGANIKIDGATVCNAVCGDEAGEKQNLYLVGTADKPIVINGPVVVRGNVVISGYVSGQGAIYSGGNVYCPNSVNYKNPPTSPRPADNAQDTTQAWLSANKSKDFLGLFARENVVVGDCSHWLWQYYVGWWMGNAMNKSDEDAGIDGIPNTAAGKDGIIGTADDDVLESDGVFTVEHYTETDQALGLIPSGKNVGDVIPGTGEDIDGDGVHDGSITLSNLVLSTPLNTANWSGNMPAAGIASYSSIASLYANQLDAVFYTNHAFCDLVLGGSSAKMNGAVISRNESIIYGTPTLEVNQDCRLLGGSSGPAASLLPVEMQPIEILRWTQVDRDSNRYPVQP